MLVIKPTTLGLAISVQVVGCRAILRTVPAVRFVATIDDDAAAARMLLISSI